MAGAVVVGVSVAVAWRHLRRRRRRQSVLRRYGFIPDSFTDLGQVQAALTGVGMPHCEMIVGIDYGERNASAGVQTFNNENLHRIIPEHPNPNPYQYALFLLAKSLKAFDSDAIIPIYGMCATPTEATILSLGETRVFEDLLEIYTRATPAISTVGRPSWPLIIQQAVDHVTEAGRFHILIVLTTGAVELDDLRQSLIFASHHPLAIVAIGLGDGPFSDLQRIDDEVIPGRLFDNFQFFNLHSVLADAKFPDVAFALAALQEIPFQYAALRELGYNPKAASGSALPLHA
jgi:hypothetical protein